ncbi:Acetyltransferase (GNAT) family protein [Poseidonocella pacifica]|uniref:Acetyltransferase (GNAT) family protein n=1 Tax=Poseidonocella pacifica TaxID=871651 RepID=A0A1I0YF43_9RHOB|nr:GNAT family N-acetyltransferase [Poseidonocella pacifica]SFB10793.1 Acetyltransferase (GNAT) family protein [Poseidonocella pacifica]
MPDPTAPATPPVIVARDPRDPGALYCLHEYYKELARRFDQGFEVHLSRDPEATTMIPPTGAFFVAMSGETPLGCAALKGQESWGEVKRVWVSPTARGMGLARRLMTAVEEAARQIGLPVLRLDTNEALPEAIALYRNSGWHEIPRFNDDPYPTHFFEKHL